MNKGIIGSPLMTKLQHLQDVELVDLTEEQLIEFETYKEETNMKNLGMNALAAAMLAGSMGDNEIAQKFANGNVIPHGKLRPINTHKRFNRYDGSNPAFKTQYNKSK